MDAGGPSHNFVSLRHLGKAGDCIFQVFLRSGYDITESKSMEREQRGITAVRDDGQGIGASPDRWSPLIDAFDHQFRMRARGGERVCCRKVCAADLASANERRYSCTQERKGEGELPSPLEGQYPGAGRTAGALTQVSLRVRA